MSVSCAMLTFASLSRKISFFMSNFFVCYNYEPLKNFIINNHEAPFIFWNIKGDEEKGLKIEIMPKRK